MNDGVRVLRVNAVELLRQPGSTRDVDAAVDPTDIEVAHDSLTGEIVVDVRLEALNDGITVHGAVSAPWSGVCRRCLKELAGTASANVDELYQIEITDDEAYPIENNQLDLAPMTRQLIMLALDDERLCRDDCAGLCPLCGVELNVASCDCDTDVKDHRWAALEGLKLDD